MTDKELKHLSKMDLIEIIYQMKKTELELQSELETANARLNAREIKISEAGSIAEAVVGLNGIFEVAQKTADEYIAQIRSANAGIEERCKALDEDTTNICKVLKEETDSKCKALEEETENKCKALKEKTESECKTRIEETDRVIAEKWQVFERKVNSLLAAHEELQSLLK